MAVTVALELLVNDPVVRLKVAVVALAAIAIDTGSVMTELLLVRLTDAPPAGAGWGRVTVQVAEEFGPRLEGVQTRLGVARPTTTAARLTDVFTEELL